MDKNLIPVEVVAHFDTKGLVTPYKIKFMQGNIKILNISKTLKHETCMYAGNIVEIYECIALVKSSEIYLALNYERKINKWFLTKI